ncbi:hypothetical protein GBAR_LOCUS18089, partial [Geodia barretti]
MTHLHSAVTRDASDPDGLSLYLTGEYRCVVSDGHSSIERVFHLELCSVVDDKEEDSQCCCASIGGEVVVRIR